MHGSKGRSNEKAKDFKGSIKKILLFNKEYILIIIVALFLSFLSSVLAIIGPDKLKEITNIITNGLMSYIDLKAIKKIGIVLLLLYSFSFIFNYIQGYIMAYVTNKVSRKMRNAIAVKINKMPFSYFDKTTVGDVLSRVTNDVDTVSQTINQSIGSLVSAFTMFFGSIIMMFYTNYILAITAIISSLFGFVIMGKIMTKSQKYFNSVQKELGNINGHIEEVFSSLNVVKIYNATDEINNKFDKINEKLFKDGIQS